LARRIEIGRLPSLIPADFPKPLHILALLGPGVVLASFNLGSGELIWWPYLVAKYGLAFAWLIIPAGLLQWWINLELARYVVVTGESPWVALARISRKYFILMWAFAIVTLAWWGGYAGACGTALAALTEFPPMLSAKGRTLFWSYVVIAFSYLALVLSPVVYKAIERFLTACMLVAVAGIVVVAFHPVFWRFWPEFASALLTPRGMPPNWDVADAGILITSIAYTGLGGFWQLTYAYWIREAGCGMAGYVGRITSPVTGKPETISLYGYAPRDSPENRERYRLWMRPIYANNTFGVLVNLFTTVLCAFLAFAILHPMGVWPKGYRLLVEQAHFFGKLWGLLGFKVFLFVAAMGFIDTYIVILDFVPRLYAEAIQVVAGGERGWSYRRLYYALVSFFAVWTGVTLLFAKPGPLIIWGGILNFIAMPVLHASMLYMNYRLLPRRAGEFLRPATRWLVIGIVCTAAYTALTAWYLATIAPTLLA